MELISGTGFNSDYLNDYKTSVLVRRNLYWNSLFAIIFNWLAEKTVSSKHRIDKWWLEEVQVEPLVCKIQSRESDCGRRRRSDPWLRERKAKYCLFECLVGFHLWNQFDVVFAVNLWFEWLWCLQICHFLISSVLHLRYTIRVRI